MQAAQTTEGTESLEDWLAGYRQRRRAEYQTDADFERHVRVLFCVSGYVKRRGWKLEDLDAALKAVRGQPVPSIPKGPTLEPLPESTASRRAADTPLPPVPKPRPARAIGTDKSLPRAKYCTEPGCRRRLPDYRTRAGLCPHHQQIHRRATWRNQKRRQRKPAQLCVEGLSYT